MVTSLAKKDAEGHGKLVSVLWFTLHLLVVYVIVNFVTPWLAGWTWGTLLPLFQERTSAGRFEFIFSHILAFSAIPAFLAGLINAKFSHKAAELVWLVPTVVLAYKFATFSPSSVLQNRTLAAFHQYFGGGFQIPEFRNWDDLFSIASSNSDMARGMAQLNFTAFFYGGVGYSLAAWVCVTTKLNERLQRKIEKWQEKRFDPR